MALAFYSEPHEDHAITSTNPFTVTFDGRLGGKLAKKVYLRNDNTARWYSDISITPRDTSGINIVNGSISGYEWKVLEKDVAPTLEEWELEAAGDTLDVGSSIGSSIFGDIITYLPIWIMVQIPRGQAVQNIIDVVLRIEATENVV